jgi:GxxExxY protein
MDNPDFSRAETTSRIIGAAIQVHRTLGPGLLESMYESCLAYELRKRGLHVERQVRVPVMYDGQTMDCEFVVDLIVEREVVVEVKAVLHVVPVHEAQVLTYLRITGLHIGLILNFNVPRMKDGLHRFVLD